MKFDPMAFLLATAAVIAGIWAYDQFFRRA